LHVLARNAIRSYGDLRGKKVNFNLKDSQTEVTAEIIFDMLKIDVQRTNYDNDEAVKKLRDGDIEAMIILTGAPQAALAKLKKEDGVHFLALDERSLPGHDVRAILEHYLPAELTSKQYPALIDEGTMVPTVANRALLVVYAWPPNSVRYNRIAKFVHEFFGKIDQFQNSARHPKWKDISIAAEIPGWTRFKPAADWLAQHRTIALNQSSPIGSPGDLKLAFDQFVENYAISTGQRTFSADEREVLFTKFKQFIQSQTSTRSVR
jgi:uncharacterized protein